MKQYSLTFQATQIETEVSVFPPALCIGNLQQCMDKLKNELYTIHKVFALLNLTIEITELTQIGDGLVRRFSVNHNHGNETHATFTISEYKPK